MNLEEILKNISAWNILITKEVEIVEQFSKLNYYNFNHSFKENHTDLHAYIGYNEVSKNFEMYTIPAKYDHPDYEKELASHIQTSTIEWKDASLLPANPLEYKERVENWNNEAINWIPTQIKTAERLFRAFNIPSNYMVTNSNYGIYFALKTRKSSTHKISDLIVASDVSGNIELYNNSNSVPPFLNNSSFYLIELADK